MSSTKVVPNISILLVSEASTPVKSGNSEDSLAGSSLDGGVSEGENSGRFSSGSVSPGVLSDKETAENDTTLTQQTLEVTRILHPIVNFILVHSKQPSTQQSSTHHTPKESAADGKYAGNL